MKRFIYILIVLLTVTFSSCKKETYHRIKFEVEFIEDCDNCVADYFAINCTPHYSDEEPVLPASEVVDGWVWTYEYWTLKDGDDVVENDVGGAFYLGPTGYFGETVSCLALVLLLGHQYWCIHCYQL